jgi:phenylalanyl-tRNA synthetase alpha chain
LANREIGALPQARRDAGIRVGQARSRIGTALRESETGISEAELVHALTDERVDVTLPVADRPVGAVPRMPPWPRQPPDTAPSSASTEVDAG